MFEAEKQGQLMVQARNTLDPNHVNKIVILDFDAFGFSERSFTKEEWKDATKKRTFYEYYTLQS